MTAARLARAGSTRGGGFAGAAASAVSAASIGFAASAVTAARLARAGRARGGGLATLLGRVTFTRSRLAFVTFLRTGSRANPFGLGRATGFSAFLRTRGVPVPVRAVAAALDLLVEAGFVTLALRLERLIFGIAGFGARAGAGGGAARVERSASARARAAACAAARGLPAGAAGAGAALYADATRTSGAS